MTKEEALTIINHIDRNILTDEECYVVDNIFELVAPSLPSDLDEAAEISDLEAKNLADDYTKFLAAGLTNNEPRPIGPQWMKKLALDRFKEGAEWMAGQGGIY